MAEIIFIEDRQVDEHLNRQLIELIAGCFDYQPIFQQQRYYKEMPALRWYMEQGDKLYAHVAVHKKLLSAPGADIKVGGIAEVAVHPDYRGRGLVKLMLAEVNRWLAAHDFAFAMLYGNPEVYRSSGYRSIENEVCYFDLVTKSWKTEVNKEAMVAVLGNQTWPAGLIQLNGPTF
jgi:predicted acetyltransferase